MSLRHRALVALIACSALAGAAEPPLVIGDFEGSLKPFNAGDGVRVVAEHATSGAHAAQVDGGAALVADEWSGLTKDWSRYDLVRFDVFVPGDQPAQLAIQVRDQQNEPGYWAWHDRYLAATPGANQIQFAVSDLWRGEILRRDVPGMLDVKDIRRLVITNQGKTPIFVDHVRLEAFPVAKVSVPGLRAFDVGLEGSPEFTGFTPLTEKSAYDAKAGFGWLPGVRFMQTSPDVCTRLHPDNLFRDWLSIGRGTLRVDVPNGTWRVLMQLEDPGAWEYMQNYRHRVVTANGKTVVDESMSCDQFLDRYFRNQDAEDRPGEDPFDRYVEPRFPWHDVEVTVTEGHLDLGFETDETYANTLSALIVAPAQPRAEVDQYLAYVKELRRFDWSQRWKASPQPAAAAKPTGALAAEAARDGFALRAVSPYASGDLTGAWADDPVAAADPTVKALAIAAAQGETEPATFGFVPARKLGRVTVAVSALKAADGAALPADAIDVRVGRYRFSRQGEQSGLYHVAERELRHVNTGAADALVADDGLARRFWVTAAVPVDAHAGRYRGTVTVKAEHGGARELPLEVEVLPLRLPEPRHAFAMYGCGVVPSVYYPEQAKTRHRDLETMYRDLAAHGLNYNDELDVALECRLQDGKLVVTNADDFEALLALRRKYGFRDDLPLFFPTNGGLDDLAGGKSIAGMDAKAFIAAWYGGLTDLAKARGWPHPIFCFGDEPTTDQICDRLTAIHRALHAVSPDIWTAIAYDLHGPASERMQATVDVHHLKGFCPVDDFRKAKANAKLILNCNVGYGRAAYGLREWRAMRERGVDGCITYAYTGSHVDIYYDLDGRESDYSCSPPRRDGTRDTTAYWELTREGVDDFRYARAVEALATDAAAPADAVAQAKALLRKAEEIGALDDKAAIPAAIAWRRDAQKLLAARASP